MLMTFFFKKMFYKLLVFDRFASTRRDFMTVLRVFLFSEGGGLLIMRCSNCFQIFSVFLFLCYIRL